MEGRKNPSPSAGGGPQSQGSRLPRLISFLAEARNGPESVLVYYISTALDADRDFLKHGNVFTDSFIDGNIDLKRAGCQEYAEPPHPIEFKMYYGV
jgi:hypothetical protein